MKNACFVFNRYGRNREFSVLGLIFHGQACQSQAQGPLGYWWFLRTRC